MAKMILPDETLAWAIAWAAVVLLCTKESLRLKAYKCPAGKWTLGWGETEGIKPGMTWTKEQADARLCAELTRYAAEVQSMCKEPPNENQLGAFVCLAYNIGLPRFKTSTVLRQYNRGNHAAAARAFALWNKATVDGRLVVLPGLVSRRAAEAALFLTPDEDDEAPAHPMPQAVAAEPKLSSSPTMQTGTLTVGAGSLTLLSSLKDQADTAADSVGVVQKLAGAAHDLVTGLAASFGVQPVTLLGVAILVAGGLTMYRRHKQRLEGLA